MINVLKAIELIDLVNVNNVPINIAKSVMMIQTIVTHVRMAMNHILSNIETKKNKNVLKWNVILVVFARKASVSVVHKLMVNTLKLKAAISPVNNVMLIFVNNAKMII